MSSRTSDQVYAVDPKTMAWDWWQTGYDIALIRSAGDRLVAASLNDGVLVGPRIKRRQEQLCCGCEREAVTTILIALSAGRRFTLNSYCTLNALSTMALGLRPAGSRREQRLR
ncbi:MAG: hypothetical protein WDM87_04740 [Terracidiphilus sp.]